MKRHCFHLSVYFSISAVMFIQYKCRISTLTANSIICYHTTLVAICMRKMVNVIFVVSCMHAAELDDLFIACGLCLVLHTIGIICGPFSRHVLHMCDCLFGTQK
jgi:hypothetical protein